MHSSIYDLSKDIVTYRLACEMSYTSSGQYRLHYFVQDKPPLFVLILILPLYDLPINGFDILVPFDLVLDQFDACSFIAENDMDNITYLYDDPGDRKGLGKHKATRSNKEKAESIHILPFNDSMRSHVFVYIVFRYHSQSGKNYIIHTTVSIITIVHYAIC